VLVVALRAGRVSSPCLPLCSSHTCLPVVWRRVVRSIYMALVPVATMCMWLMWVCTWLHQWHPIILPTKHAESVQA
jgi:hypothetical protein